MPPKIPFDSFCLWAAIQEAKGGVGKRVIGVGQTDETTLALDFGEEADLVGRRRG